ncbi:MAG: MFS transporter [Hyphomonadaceae bacterium]|nr:MAG: glycoside/pentoside/hexuronide transporter [Caulobacteraceae bacterium]MBT9447664.1 MFS transporter [Hyphomonadaceae bacterium]TPW05216.1 MAG: glycoside/pentoside/hexuronide transporter [Alphaproteobacteria bacterium]
MGQGLPLQIKLGWAVGELAIAAFVVLQMAFMLFYCTEALAIPPAIAGLALLAPRLLDAFADPLMGAISDRTRSSFGRRRLYLLLGAPLLGLSFAAVFFIPADGPLNVRVALLVVTFMLSNAAVTIYEVPYSAMAAEMTSSYRERTSLTGYKMIAARLGGVAVAFAAPMIFGSQESLTAGFRLLGVCAGAFMLVTGLWAYVATAKAPRIETTPSRFSLREEISAVMQNRAFCALWVAFLLQNLAIGAAATTLIYFVTQVMAVSPQLSGLFMATGGVAAVIATPVWVFLARRLGKRRGYYAGLATVAVSAIPALVIAPAQSWLLFPILIVAGVGEAATQLFPNAMAPDTVEVDELTSGLRREGAIFGAWGFCRKLGMTGGAFLVSIGLSAIGFVPGAPPGTQPHEALQGIRIIYAAVPIGLWLATMAAFSRYDLTEARFEEIKRDIQIKKGTLT